MDSDWLTISPILIEVKRLLITTLLIKPDNNRSNINTLK